MPASAVDSCTSACFASFRISSDSMSPGLREGDFVLVWKPVVGARLLLLHV